MKNLILIFLSLVQFSEELQCINGFTLVNNKCLKLITADQTHSAARRECNLNGGNLVSIYNSIDNTAIAQLAISSSDPIWIGLNCMDDRDLGSCFWDDQVGNASAFNNFIAANPSSEVGTCVYMLNFGSLRGRWFSGSCEGMEINAVCETTPIETCLYTYNGYCYYPLGALSQIEAQNACSQNCKGDLVSIHSAEENTLVSRIFEYNPKRYLWIGAQGNSWIDGSVWNYTNIGYQNTTTKCYSMSLINGRWMSTDCYSQLPAICKISMNSECGNRACSGVTNLTDTGVIYSPNYPNSYRSAHNQSIPCYYLFTVKTEIAIIYFEQLTLNQNARIELYSSLTSQTPFAIIKNSQGTNITFQSSTNLIKMVFKPCFNCGNTGNSEIFKWKAILGQQYLNPCGNLMETNGVITSLGYPGNYPNNWQCDYLLHSSRRVQVHFTDFYTEGYFDYVRVYDGENSTAPVLATISGIPVDNLTYTSTGQYLYLLFSTDKTNNFRGFSAVFYDFN